jgi:hypothetical protein
VRRDQARDESANLAPQAKPGDQATGTAALQVRTQSGEERLKGADATAVDLIPSHGHRVEAFAQALIKRRALSEAETEDIIRKAKNLCKREPQRLPP